MVEALTISAMANYNVVVWIIQLFRVHSKFSHSYEKEI